MGANRKRLNTALFVIGATLVNVLIMACLMLLCLSVVGLVFGGRLPRSVLRVLYAVFCLGSIVAAFFIYRALLSLVASKVDLDKHFLKVIGKAP